MKNDICLIKLSRPPACIGARMRVVAAHALFRRADADMPVADEIGHVQLDKGSHSSPGTLATVAGWGATHAGGAQEHLPDVLQYVNVPILENRQCKYSLAGGDINIASSMICAGVPEGGKDACQARR